MTYDNSKTGKVTGLWKKDTQSGKVYYTATITVAQLQEAVKTTQVTVAGDGSRIAPDQAKITLKVWVNQDKNNERSPDMNLTVAPPPTPTDAPARPAELTADDIPF
jgi:hypothetical protein|tara:strand:- start:6938 stop:7255 length:318 start_codon:yes stop_codon:yes gene_type:complete